MSDVGRIIPYSGAPPVVVDDRITLLIGTHAARCFKLCDAVTINGRAGVVDRIDVDAGEIRVAFDDAPPVLVHG